MKQLLTTLAGAAVVALLLPFALVGWRIANSWTNDNTQQVLGGVLTMCGGSVVIAALAFGFVMAVKITKDRAVPKAEFNGPTFDPRFPMFPPNPQLNSGNRSLSLAHMVPPEDFAEEGEYSYRYEVPRLPHP